MSIDAQVASMGPLDKLPARNTVVLRPTLPAGSAAGRLVEAALPGHGHLRGDGRSEPPAVGTAKADAPDEAEDSTVETQIRYLCGLKRLRTASNSAKVAETEGFEPSVPLRGLHLSRVVH